jgi:hypothetical protein
MLAITHRLKITPTLPTEQPMLPITHRLKITSTVLMKPDDYYRVHKGQHLVLISSHMNQSSALISYFFTINFSVILPSSLFPNHSLLSDLQSKTSWAVLMLVTVASVIPFDVILWGSDKQLEVLDTSIYKFLHTFVTLSLSLTYLHVTCFDVIRFT